MTTYTDEVNIYNPEAVGEGIDGAAQTATNYIRTDETGIRIANANPGTATTYQHQTATETEFVVNSQSVTKLGEDMRLGRESLEHVRVSRSGFDYSYGSKSLFAIEPSYTAEYDVDTVVFSKTITNSETSWMVDMSMEAASGTTVTDAIPLKEVDGTYYRLPIFESYAEGQASGEAAYLFDFGFGGGNGLHAYHYELACAPGATVNFVIAKATPKVGFASTRIGNDDESHQTLDYHSMQMVDKEGNTYFYVSDLRGTDGYATIVERDDNPDNQSHEITVSYPPRSVGTTTVVIDGTTTATVTSVRGTLDGHGVVVIAEELEEFVPVEVTYQTDSPEVKAFTFGSRADGPSVGSHSVAIGSNNGVSGFYSLAEGANNHVASPYAVALGANNTVQCNAFAAIGEGNTADYQGAVAIGSGLTASGLNQTVIGQNNIADTAGKYLFIIGNGPFLSSKSNAATIAWNGNYIAQAMAGIIQMFAGATAPDGWLICDGSAVSRTTYATLFAAIGTTWGAGDGSTTFNLPDLRGRAPIGAGTGSSLTARTLGGKGGAESVTLTAAQSGLPAHTHGFTNPKIPNHVHTMDHGHGFTQPKVNRAQNAGSGTNRYAIQGTDNSVNVSAHSGAVKDFDGNTGNPTSLGSTTGGAVGAVTGGAKDATNAHNNMQPFAVVNFIICTGKTS